MDQMKIGSFIAARRKERGWTQSQLAEQLGITDKAVSKWENGKSMPDLSLFLPLCSLLGISLNELMAGEMIPEEKLKEKSNQVLFDVITSWLGKEQGERPIQKGDGNTLLKLENVKKIYQTEHLSTVAVDHVSLQIQQGSFIGIMGASGSGKSSLLNMIATIDDVTQGTIEIKGQDISKLSEKELSSFRKEHIGFIFQEYNLLDTLTVYENIALAMTIKEMKKENIKRNIFDLANTLKIEEILDKFPYEISGGQRQRCACARAIATNPSLVLADEPTGALDSHAAKQLLETLIMLQKDYGATILMVTHDALSASYCDKIFFMKDGNIREILERGQDNKQVFFTKILDATARVTEGVHYVS